MARRPLRYGHREEVGAVEDTRDPPSKYLTSDQLSAAASRINEDSYLTKQCNMLFFNNQ